MARPLYLDSSAVLRTVLDALHLATYTLARREIEGLELLTADARLQEAAAATRSS